MAAASDHDDELDGAGTGHEGEHEHESESESGEGGSPRGHPAIYSSNWRTVLVVDAAMGVAVAVAGVVVAVVWNVAAGGVLGSLGVLYVALVVRRGRDWADQRRRAGL